jgi:phenylalanyl-tRNA synthetase alpha chain
MRPQTSFNISCFYFAACMCALLLSCLDKMLPPKPASIPPSVWGRIGRNLYRDKSHPVGIVSGMIHDHFVNGRQTFTSFKLPPTPIVTTGQAFDQLLVPKDHCLRSKSDTYYVDAEHVLRPHATSHQRDVLASLRPHSGSPLSTSTGAIWTCDVYRKDEVDRIHFPVFHQTDGVCLFPDTTSEQDVVRNLQSSLEELMGSLFDKANIPLRMRWDYTATFPFTHPSMELEILPGKDGKWIECLGCGKIRTEIDQNGWAFGIGIDRLAMLLFQIDDIRLLWSEDVRFLNQFVNGQLSKYKAFSKYPPTYRDSSFWVPRGMLESDEEVQKFQFECMKMAGPNGLENIELVDRFIHPREGRMSVCFRYTYRGIEKTLTADECNDVHNGIVNAYIESIGGELR